MLASSRTLCCLLRVLLERCWFRLALLFLVGRIILFVVVCGSLPVFWLALRQRAKFVPFHTHKITNCSRSLKLIFIGPGSKYKPDIALCG
uniref:Uncharacterized protein n=1 Tax=Ixodes ricinus TaxID=34613 RepID=A0A6B0UAT3_IXORI